MYSLCLSIFSLCTDFVAMQEVLAATGKALQVIGTLHPKTESRCTQVAKRSHFTSSVTIVSIDIPLPF